MSLSITVSMFLLLIFSRVCVGGGESEPMKDRPNFVWLISEDNSSHFLKLFNDRGAETPNIAKLARDGLEERLTKGCQPGVGISGISAGQGDGQGYSMYVFYGVH